MLTLAWGKILSNSSVGEQLRHQSAVDKQEHFKIFSFRERKNSEAQKIKNAYSLRIISARSKIETIIV